MRMESKLSAGQILDGRYKITQFIGSGGTSHVHLAEDMRLPGKKWAIKECVTTGISYVNVQSEAELLISLSHSRLPRIVDFYPPDKDGYSYLVMDYINGLTLSNYMTSIHGELSAATLLMFARQLLEVLQYLHNHNPPIVYRDLKPSNIMVTGQTELMLIDFGIARTYRSGNQEDTVKLGTVGFAAPEQYGGGQSGPQSDLYGLGALLLYMATGGLYSQWQNGMERLLKGSLPPELISVIQRLLHYHPEDRYPDVQSVLNAISGMEGNSRTYPTQRLPEGTRTCIVGVMGVAKGLGTTHTSLALSGFLSDLGTTAWLDLSAADSPIYHRIRNMATIEENFEPRRDLNPFFEWNGIHYGKRPEEGSLAGFMGGEFRFVVLDLGIGSHEGTLEEFARSDIPVLVASGADWRLEEVMMWFRRSGLHKQSRWKICLPLAGKAAVTLLQSAFAECKVYGLPVQSNPFKLEEKFMDILSDMVHPYAESSNKRKRAVFFQRKKS